MIYEQNCYNLNVKYFDNLTLKGIYWYKIYLHYHNQCFLFFQYISYII